jgi:hypothetical protein
MPIVTLVSSVVLPRRRSGASVRMETCNARPWACVQRRPHVPTVPSVLRRCLTLCCHSSRRPAVQQLAKRMLQPSLASQLPWAAWLCTCLCPAKFRLPLQALMRATWPSELEHSARRCNVSVMQCVQCVQHTLGSHLPTMHLQCLSLLCSTPYASTDLVLLPFLCLQSVCPQCCRQQEDTAPTSMHQCQTATAQNLRSLPWIFAQWRGSPSLRAPACPLASMPVARTSPTTLAAQISTTRSVSY